MGHTALHRQGRDFSWTTSSSALTRSCSVGRTRSVSGRNTVGWTRVRGRRQTKPRRTSENRAVAPTVVDLSVGELLTERRAELEQLWLDVWPGTADRLYGILPRHTRRTGFRFLAAQERGRIVGFAYGYVGGGGEAWHECVAREMTETQRERWLAPGEFEFVELGIHPSRRRRGLAGRLPTSCWTARGDRPPSSRQRSTMPPRSRSTSAAAGRRSSPRSESDGCTASWDARNNQALRTEATNVGWTSVRECP